MLDLAVSLGGMVQEADRGPAGGGAGYGTAVLRVPGDRVESALTSLGALGKVVGLQTSGQVVTGQYVDLESRLRHWQAQEEFLLGLFANAVSVADRLAIRAELQAVQLEIELHRGQLNVLNDQVALATPRVEVTEAPPIVEQPAPPAAPTWVDHRVLPPLRALRSFAGGLLSAAIFLVPFLVLAAAALAVAHEAGRRRGRTFAVPFSPRPRPGPDPATRAEERTGEGTPG